MKRSGASGTFCSKLLLNYPEGVNAGPHASVARFSLTESFAGTARPGGGFVVGVPFAPLAAARVARPSVRGVERGLPQTALTPALSRGRERERSESSPG